MFFELNGDATTFKIQNQVKLKVTIYYFWNKNIIEVHMISNSTRISKTNVQIYTLLNVCMNI